MSFVPLPDYNSESDSSEVDENLDPHSGPPKNLRQVYIECHSFGSKLEAVNFVKSEKIWKQQSTSLCENGKKIYYNCKVQRSCPVKMNLFLDAASQNVSYF